MDFIRIRSKLSNKKKSSKSLNMIIRIQINKTPNFTFQGVKLGAIFVIN